MANIYDYINNVADKDGLVTGINYNMQESPTSSAYHQIAAQDNPDYAQAIGDIYRYGDINRANFNLGMNTLAGLSNKKYLEKVQQEQRAYAEQLADKKFEREKELFKLKNMFALRNLAPRLNSTGSKNVTINNNGETIQKPEDYKYKLATEMEGRNLPEVNEFYNKEGFNGANSTGLNIDKTKKEAQYLQTMRAALLDPYNYPGTSEQETKFLLDKLFNKYMQQIEAFNNKAEPYQNIALQNDVDVGNNYISNQINAEDPDIKLKNELLKDYLVDNNLQLPTNGWNNSPETQQVYMYLENSGIDLTNRYPIDVSDNIILYNTDTGSIESLTEDDSGNLSLQTIQQIEHPVPLSERFSGLTNLFGNIKNKLSNINQIRGINRRWDKQIDQNME